MQDKILASQMILTFLPTNSNIVLVMKPIKTFNIPTKYTGLALN